MTEGFWCPVRCFFVKMLNGKRLNVLSVCMLQLIAEVVIQSVFTDGKCQNAEDVMRALDQIGS